MRDESFFFFSPRAGWVCFGPSSVAPEEGETEARQSDSTLKQNQKHPGTVQKSQKKSASLRWKDIINDQRTLRKLQKSLNVRFRKIRAIFLFQSKL